MVELPGASVLEGIAQGSADLAAFAALQIGVPVPAVQSLDARLDLYERVMVRNPQLYRGIVHNAVTEIGEALRQTEDPATLLHLHERKTAFLYPSDRKAERLATRKFTDTPIGKGTSWSRWEWADESEYYFVLAELAKTVGDAEKVKTYVEAAIPRPADVADYSAIAYPVYSWQKKLVIFQELGEFYVKAAEKARGLEHYDTRDRAMDHAKTVYDTLFGYVKSLAEVSATNAVLASEIDKSYATATQLCYHQWQRALLDLMLDIAPQWKHSTYFLQTALSATADLKQHVREKGLEDKVEYIETKLGLVPYSTRLKKLAKQAWRWFDAPTY